MATLKSVASKAYAVNTYTIPFTIPAGMAGLRFTFTRESWPAGLVASAEIDWSDGSKVSSSFSGGAVVMGGVAITKSFFEVPKPAGVTSGTAVVQVLQGLTTSILVESM